MSKQVNGGGHKAPCKKEPCKKREANRQAGRQGSHARRYHSISSSSIVRRGNEKTSWPRVRNCRCLGTESITLVYMPLNLFLLSFSCTNFGSETCSGRINNG